MSFQTLDEILRIHAKQRPDKIALRAERRTWTYRQLHEESARVAQALLAEGVSPQQRVAVEDWYFKLGSRVCPITPILSATPRRGLDTPIPYAAIKSYQFVLIAAALFDSRSEIRVGARLKIVALVVLIVGLATIGTTLYLYAHPVGANYVSTIQGRYLIPLSPLLLLYNRTLRASLLAWFPREQRIARGCSAGLLAFLILSSALSCFVVARRYYL